MKWEIVKLSDIASQVRGVSYKPENVAEKISANCLPVLRANNITDSGLNVTDVVYIDKKVISNKQLLKKGDIVIAASSGSKHIVGKASLFNIDWAGSFGAFCKVVRPSSKIHPIYLSFYFQTDVYRKKISNLSAGANINNIRGEHIDDLEIPLPPLKVQERIAAILDEADALRKKDAELLKKYDELLQSIFYDMFGDFDQNVKDWTYCNVEKLLVSNKDGTKCGPFGSALKKHEYVNDGIPVWVMDNINDVEFRSEGSLYITSEKYKELKSYSVINGDIIISRAGTVGKMAVVENIIGSSIISTNLIRLRLNAKLVLPNYFVFLMKYAGDKLGRLKKGKDGSFTHMNTGILKSLNIPLPSIEIQSKFEKILQSINSQKQQILSQQAQSEALFQSLMQRAFKGEL